MQVAPATKSQHAVQLQQMAAVAGGTGNAKMTVSTASASATFTADEVAVKSGLGGAAWLLSNYSKVINLATTGAGGMDTGAAPVNGWVALYAIYNPVSGASSILAVNSPNTVMPAVYGGANMPAGYTASALLTVVATNASSQFKVCTVKGRKIYIQLATAYSGRAIISNNPIAISGIIPANAMEVSGELTVGSSALSTMSLTILPDASIVGQQSMTTTVGAGQALTLNYTGLPINTVQQLMFTSSSTAGIPTFNIYIASYSI
ncbi:hypothetical protein ACQKP5_14615 [Pseudomonas vancouverensis]|uniref:hypothetical protein n=1 Tax=Pseudomonas vancouverensis TaxID=95300 RepID=UPI003CFC5716